MSLVLELQKLAQDTREPLTTVLRSAKIVASKLALDDTCAWVSLELDGYTRLEDLPSYRKVICQLVVQVPHTRDQPVQFEDLSAHEHFTTFLVYQSAAALEALCSSEQSSFTSPVAPAERQALIAGGDRRLSHFPIARKIPANAFAAVRDAIRNRVLSWALDLERKGILGANMTFTLKEKEVASKMTINIHGNNNTVSSASNSDGATLTTTGSVISTRLDVALEKLRAADPVAASAIEKAVRTIEGSSLVEEKRQEAAEQLTILVEECGRPESERQPAISKALAVALRESLSLASDVMQVWPTIAPILGGLLSLKF